MNGKIVTQLIAVRLGRNVASVILPFEHVLVLITDSIRKELQKELNIKFFLFTLCRHAGRSRGMAPFIHNLGTRWM